MGGGLPRGSAPSITLSPSAAAAAAASPPAPTHLVKRVETLWPRACAEAVESCLSASASPPTCGRSPSEPTSPEIQRFFFRFVLFLGK